MTFLNVVVIRVWSFIMTQEAGATAEAYRNGLVNAPLSRLRQVLQHSYVSGNTVWQALDESRVGWHTANQLGNKYYYGIEVCQSMGADNATFLKMNRQLSRM